MSCITLIGMPGAGKSTIGPLLAKALGKKFIDTDDLLVEQFGRPLQHIINQSGYQYFRAQEEKLLLSLPLTDEVIATGGSAVHSQLGMERLRYAGPVIYLMLPLETIIERIADGQNRGLASPPQYSVADIFADREPLYKTYATHCIDCNQLEPALLVAELVKIISSP